MPKRSGATPAVAYATKRASGCEPALLRRRGRHHHDGRGAVARLRRVAGGHGAGRVKRRPQLGQRLGGGIAPRPFVLRERHVAHAGRAAVLRRRRPVNVSGVISSAKRPASMAASARWWLRSANASCSSREIA